MIALAVVAGDPLLHHDLAEVFAAHPRIRLVSADGERGQRDRAPDVTLLDLDSSLPACPRTEIRRTAGESRVLVTSSSTVLADVAAVLHAGARGYVPRKAGGDVLERAVVTVAQGGVFLPWAVARALRCPAPDPAAIPPLAPREQEVLRHIADGCTHAQAARHMGISVGTLETYLRRVRRKFAIGSPADLVRFALAMTRPVEWSEGIPPESGRRLGVTAGCPARSACSSGDWDRLSGQAYA
ncbi:DNA-binding response regulator [Carbonactinospora thermoautotrophica]|uniref:Regulatory protein n=1 Tax=Carbonactinospora thermoautotrophica TaxID=1469144 RepID=A0A132MNW5_9ACTN|nr:response regulator transcription factor [Carbonactinospora thermoautotrophica]KWW99425.1 regulatory protein [Carbonactinospora thermoautotrophica]MCX9192454.1 DNA-binding response regulator [Carbonactinospora thermoautotrophica]